MTGDGQDRRRHRRFALGKPARIVLAPTRQESRGELMDLSRAGASVVTDIAVTAGVGIYIYFVVGDVEHEATGSVLRAFPFGARFGLAIDLGFVTDPFLAFLDRLASASEAGRPDIMDEIEGLTIRIA